jgi:hypothetical protein
MGPVNGIRSMRQLLGFLAKESTVRACISTCMHRAWSCLPAFCLRGEIIEIKMAQSKEISSAGPRPMLVNSSSQAYQQPAESPRSRRTRLSDVLRLPLLYVKSTRQFERKQNYVKLQVRWKIDDDTIGRSMCVRSA